MNIDAGTLTGITGPILATISLIYARSQAHTQRRQVKEMQRQTEETRRAQHFETSHALMKDAIAARQVWAERFRKDWAPPSIGTPLEKILTLLDDNWDLVFRLRAYVEQLQEMFFARKADLVADDHWARIRPQRYLERSPGSDRAHPGSLADRGCDSLAIF